MADPELARETQLVNIETRTGKSRAQLCDLLKSTGLEKHNDLRDYLKQHLALGHGDAGAVVRAYFAAETPPPEAESDPLDAIYTGPKALLRPIHDALMLAIREFGEFEQAPKKTYLSLRRKKQFAMLGPATNTRFEIGLNMKDVPATERLLAMPPGGMCDYKVKLATVAEADAEVIAWLRIAYDSAG